MTGNIDTISEKIRQNNELYNTINEVLCNVTSKKSNLVELYVGFHKVHCEKYKMLFTDHYGEYANTLEDQMYTVSRYMFEGLYKDHPDLLTENRDEIAEKLKYNLELYQDIDDILNLWLG